MNNIFKTGSCSVVLGCNHYSNFCEKKKNKLLKISNIIDNHNEFKYLTEIKKIENYDKYYSIPDEVTYLLKPTDSFYIYLKSIIREECIFNGNNLYYFYVDYAGDKELTEIIHELSDYRYENYWKSYSSILKFTKHIMNGIRFLHINKICHLDIKPENIVINTINKTAKIIDFGFASIEPFNDFVFNIKGTPGYFPKYFPQENINESFPLIDADDMIPRNNVLPIITNRKLVYKIDSYCLGRVLNYLKSTYDCNQESPIFPCISFFSINNNDKSEIKLNEIINMLLEKKVDKRITIIKCYDSYFN